MLDSCVNVVLDILKWFKVSRWIPNIVHILFYRRKWIEVLNFPGSFTTGFISLRVSTYKQFIGYFSWFGIVLVSHVIILL